MKNPFKASTLCLVDDDVVTCFRHSFRLQVWRGKGADLFGPCELTPVVLMLGIPGQVAPDYYTGRLAHIALRYVSSPPVPVFFQYSLLKGKPRAFKVQFQVGGSPLRPWLHEPKYLKVDPTTLERVFCIEPQPQTKEKT